MSSESEHDWIRRVDGQDERVDERVKANEGLKGATKSDQKTNSEDFHSSQ